MKLLIRENNYDRSWEDGYDSWKTTDNRYFPENTWKSAKLTITYEDVDGSVETSDDFEIFNEKGLPQKEFEIYIEDNVELLAPQLCEESGLVFISLDDIEYVEGGTQLDPELDDFYDPYQE